MSGRDAVERVREICLALPEAVEKSFGGHTSPAFRVRDKMFVMVSQDRTSMTFKGAAGVQEAHAGHRGAEHHRVPSRPTDIFAADARPPGVRE